MRKVAVDLMVGRKSGCHFKKALPKTNLVAHAFPIGSAVKTLYINTLLNKYGLMAEAVFENFNKETTNQKKWPTNLSIPTLILISGAKTFVLAFKDPTIYTLMEKVYPGKKELKQIIKDNPKRRELLQIMYKLAVIKTNNQKEDNYLIKAKVIKCINALNSYNLYLRSRNIDPLGKQAGDSNMIKRQRRKKKHKKRNAYKTKR